MNQHGAAACCINGADRGPIRFPFFGGDGEVSARPLDNRLFCREMIPRRSNRFTMKDDRDKRERQTGRPAKNPRADRLKLALRENLKRRKSQARARDDATMAPSNGDDVCSDDFSGKEPGK
ncbi:hypothetical protein [Bradyrhizobium sp.]|uniref:hypothetical protein n=1 Tax=Bradyrhizobium sp. TaxID=376 RepID=UPI003BB07E07